MLFRSGALSAQRIAGDVLHVEGVERFAAGRGEDAGDHDVAAKAGDLVELSWHGISVNGVLLPNTAPLSKDTKGRPLEPWHFGRFPVAQGTVWVASSYHSRSFDSRYFGPVGATAIRHRMKAFLTL